MKREFNQNSVIENIYDRHSVRRFSKRPLSDEIIDTVLAAANQAPSAHNRQSWKFVIVESEIKEELAELVTDKAKQYIRPSSSLLRMAARSIISAPAVIAVVNTGELITHGKEVMKIGDTAGFDFFRTMEIQSSAAAVENLLLAATSLGLGAVWLGILYLIKEEVLDFLQEPGGEFMAVVPVGYPDSPGKTPKKKPLEYVVKKL